MNCDCNFTVNLNTTYFLSDKQKPIKEVLLNWPNNKIQSKCTE